MNQFVPIFLGERKADVSKWAGPSRQRHPGRGHAEVHSCGRQAQRPSMMWGWTLTTTFFEMLGNWSFGDYWSQEGGHRLGLGTGG